MEFVLGLAQLHADLYVFLATRSLLGCAVLEHSAWVSQPMISFHFRYGRAWLCASAEVRAQAHFNTEARSL